MPQLPNSTDVNTKVVSPDTINIPDYKGMEQLNKESNIPDSVKAKEDILPFITPPKDFVSEKIDYLGESLNSGKNINPQFEIWLNKQKQQLEPELKQQKIDNDKARFSKIVEQFQQEGQKQVEATTTAPKRAVSAGLKGVVDFADQAMNSVVSLANVSRRFFGVDQLEKIPKTFEDLPENATGGERFARSAAKVMAGMLPISKGLQASAGIVGLTNSAMSAGMYGFLFDQDKTDGVVTSFLKDNFSLAPDIIKYLNHESDDNEFVTRLKNSANYTIDTLALEGVFYSMKTAKNLLKARNGAYTILENGDIEVKAKKVGEKDLFGLPSVSDLKLKGLTTEDISKKQGSVLSTIDEKLVKAREDVIAKYETKTSNAPDKLVQGRAEALAAIKKAPMSIEQLLKIPENAPINNQTVMQAEIASNALSSFADDIFKDAINGKVDKEVALYKIANIAETMDKLTTPRATAGRALESAKFVASLNESDKFPIETVKKMQELYGTEASLIFDEVRLSKENLTGFPAVDSTLVALRKNVDLKAAWKYLYTARINWILSDPTIHTANVTSNLITQGMRSATELTTATISKARSLVPVKSSGFGDKYLAKGASFAEARSSVQGYVMGLNKAISIVRDNLELLKKEKDFSNPKFKSLYERDSNTKYNKAIDKIINESEVANNFGNATTGKQVAKVLEHAVAGTPVGKMLSWEDDVFKGMHYMAEVNKILTSREINVSKKALQIKDAGARNAFVLTELDKLNTIRENFKKGIVDEEIDKQAKEAANYWTFNGELSDKDSVTKALASLGKFRGSFPGMRWIIPFYNTGANIANMSIEYTPVIGGLLKMGNVGGMSGLLRGGKEADTFLAKQALGTMAMLSVATTWSLMEDAFDVDFDISSIKNNKVGIKIGDFQTTLDKQNPVFKIMIATKDIMDIANISTQEEGAKAAASATAALLAEMYSPEQLISVMGMMSDLSNGKPSGIAEKITNMLKSTALSTVTPYSGAARFTQRDIIGMEKTIIGQEKGEDLLDEMIKRIKFTYLGDMAELPPRRGLFGQEIPYLRTMGYQVSDLAHDMFAGFSMEDKTIQEIMKLTREEVMSNPQNFDEFELNNTTILTMPSREIVLSTGEKYELSPKEFSDYVKYSAGEHRLFEGKTLKKTLDSFIGSSKYDRLPTKYKVSAIKDIVNLYRKAAKGILLNDKPEIMQEAMGSLSRLKQEYMNVK